MTKQRILEFLSSKQHMVISTVKADLSPQSAVMGFGQTENLEIVFGTFKNSRKYKNLMINKKVACSIGWDEEYITIQYEGVARELSKAEQEAYLTPYHAKIPSAKRYKDYPQQAYFVVSPTWIRYSDLRDEENEKIVEFVF